MWKEKSLVLKSTGRQTQALGARNTLVETLLNLKLRSGIFTQFYSDLDSKIEPRNLRLEVK